MATTNKYDNRRAITAKQCNDLKKKVQQSMVGKDKTVCISYATGHRS
eukprot:CAMPEP_0198137980 /NCGR_PEP_ID=MMETSP1443-20131203/1412_1 /TAXON_ID=186043 /ORGANISM="Entomoneis sp., Strain CCMP2396" /LENGTH=46 /DNA_ID= /DNA_START= /DNA_END= /DNA_ORIENTATION=